jgi:hypothetical protein
LVVRAGNVNYPFNVNAAIAEVAASMDLILCFLDPMGQALCSRTMDVVKELNVSGGGGDEATLL